MFPCSPGLRPGRSVHQLPWLLWELPGSDRSSQLPHQPFLYAECSLPAKPSPRTQGPQALPVFLGCLSPSLHLRTPLEMGLLPRGQGWVLQEQPCHGETVPATRPAPPPWAAPHMEVPSPQ